MNPNLLIRAATPQDAPTVAAFAQRVFAQTFDFVGYSEDNLQEYFATLVSEAYFCNAMQQGGVWLAYDGDALAGYAQTGALGLPVEHSDDAPAVELKRLYVDAPYWGEGIGLSLYEQAVAGFEQSVIYLSVFSENPRATRFYEKHGYRKLHLYDYYVGQHIDREWIMRRAPLTNIQAV